MIRELADERGAALRPAGDHAGMLAERSDTARRLVGAGEAFGLIHDPHNDRPPDGVLTATVDLRPAQLGSSGDLNRD